MAASSRWQHFTAVYTLATFMLITATFKYASFNELHYKATWRVEPASQPASQSGGLLMIRTNKVVFVV